MNYWEIIANKLKKSGWNCGYLSSTDGEDRQFWVAAAEREDAGRFIVHAHDMFPKKDHAIDYAQNRACFRSGEIRVLDSSGNVEHTIGFTRRIEGCDYGAGCLLGGSVRVVFPPYSRDMALSAGRA